MSVPLAADLVITSRETRIRTIVPPTRVPTHASILYRIVLPSATLKHGSHTTSSRSPQSEKPAYAPAAAPDNGRTHVLRLVGPGAGSGREGSRSHRQVQAAKARVGRVLQECAGLCSLSQRRQRCDRRRWRPWEWICVPAWEADW